MVKKKKQQVIEPDEAVHSSHRNFIYDEVDDFNAIGEDQDSDNSYNSSQDEDDNEQVLGLGESDSSDEDFGEVADDIQSDQAQSEAEDERGLGRRKSDFFGTDLTDQRIHNAAKLRNKASAEDALLLEEENVRRLQERMAKQSIGLVASDLIPESSVRKEKKEKSTLDKKEQLSKFKIASEVALMSKEVKELSEELSTKLLPLIEAHKSGVLQESSAVEYLRTRYFVCLNYLGSVSSLLMLANSGVDLNQHPAVSRREQFNQLIQELAPCKEKFDPVLDELLAGLDDAKSTGSKPGKGKKVSERRSKSRKMLKILERKAPKSKAQPEPEDEMEFEKETENMDVGSASSGDEEGVEENQTLVSAEERRPITYQIKKNKGLLPYRKKEQRNPRVKYKNKYKNKLKRRQGQVRAVRKEAKRYEGEASGINMYAVKSVKLK